jgi:hypothetical protein
MDDRTGFSAPAGFNVGRLPFLFIRMAGFIALGPVA